MHKTAVAVAVLAAMSIFSGCRHEENNEGVEVPTFSAKITNAYAVVVGMENSRFAGACPGAGYDADRLYNLLSQYTPNILLFKDRAATKANVAQALRNAVERAGDGLVLFCYSGHGGSEPFAGTGIEEADGKDEFLCLYDTYMRDNEIWQIISKSRGRVFLYFDACHSQTMFAVPCVRIAPPLTFDHTLTGHAAFSMLCWSGCPDSAYSYGASTGGQLTNALLRHYAANKTYEYLWDEIKNDRTLKEYEDPQSTVFGDGFTAKPVFR